MEGISRSTRAGIQLHAKWRREGAGTTQPGAANDPGGAEGDPGEEASGKERDGTGAGAAEAEEDAATGAAEAHEGEATATSASDDGRQKNAHGKRKACDGFALVNYKKPRTMSIEQLSKTYPPAIVAAVRRALDADIVFEFPRMERERFKDFDDFDAFVAEYFARLFGGYRRRSSLSTRARNEQLKTADEKARLAAQEAGKPFTSRLELLPWDSDDVFYLVVYWCLHGCIQKTRGDGERVTLYTRFTACPARVTGRLQYEEGPDGKRVWFVKLVNEYPVHNHHVSESIYRTYNTGAMFVGEDELLQRVAWAIDVGGDPRIVRDIISRETGSNYSQRKFANLVSYWLGGPPVLKSLRLLASTFGGLPGYRVLEIMDRNGVLVGIVFQSAYQRAVVRANGDTLTLDWTHNTNNRGFLQGALVATTALGTSVPVLDFLCVSQSNKMMETVFSFFIQHNPGVTEKLQSIVIDKDFGEWRTVEKMFPHTVVVLCIFHVLKWFKHVVTQPKYSIELDIRQEVLACLRAMVYATSQDALKAQKNTLRGLLSPDKTVGHKAFLVYMEDNWYQCTGMWSYAERGRVFTAGNTTSNRIESYWGSYKGTLGKKRRLDLCVEAIFQHATMIMRREEAALARFLGKTPLYPEADDRLRPVLMDLGAYTAKHVQKQWTKYLVLREQFRVLERTPHTSAVFTVRSTGAKNIDFLVDTSTWTCSCKSHRGIDLPCRHLIFVALDVLRLPVYPVVALKERWRMSEAIKLLPILTKGIAELEQIRVRLVHGGMLAGSTAAHAWDACSDIDHDGDVADNPASQFVAVRPTTLVYLAKNEISDSRVVDDLDKRNQLDTALEPAVTFATGLSSANFKDFVAEAAAAMADLVHNWQMRCTAQAKNVEDNSAQVDPATSFRGQTLDRRVVLREIEQEAHQAAWRACRASVSSEEDGEDAEDEDEEAVVDAGVPPGSVVAGNLAGELGKNVSDAELGRVVRQRLINQHRALAAHPSSHTLDELLSRPDDVDGPIATPQDLQLTPSTASQLAPTPNAPDPGLVQRAEYTLPPEKGRGVRRTSKQQQAHQGRPMAHLSQTGKTCPLTVQQHNAMVLFCVAREAASLQDRMPRVLTGATVLRRKASASVRSYLPRLLEQANAIVPQLVLEKLQVALTNQRRADGAGHFVKNSEGELDPKMWQPQYVVKIDQTREFPEELVSAFGQFYSIKDTLVAFNEDMAWVSGNWNVTDGAPRVPFLQGDADCVERVLDAKTPTKMCAEIKRAHESHVLATLLAVPETSGSRLEPGQRTCIPMLDIVGHLAFNQRLNDSVVNLALQLLGARHADVVVIDSLNMGKMRIPRATLQSTRLICFPLHQADKKHWCMLVVVRQQGRLRVEGYDPLGTVAGRKFINEHWERWCRLLIGEWNARDQRRTAVTAPGVVDVTTATAIARIPGLDVLAVTHTSQPRQPDGTSCGLFCIAWAAGFMDARESFATGARVEAAAVQLMRLRLMWLILCHATPIVDPEKQAIARAHYAKFTAYIT